MSAHAMGGIAFDRRRDTTPQIPKTLSAVNDAAHGEGSSTDPVNAAIGAIVAYFPTEVNVLYTAILAAIAGADSTSLAGQWLAFWMLLVASPIVVWFLYAARVKADGKPLPLTPKSWPIMEMIFSVIAFAVWAAALPGSPFQEVKEYSEPLAGVSVLIVVTALGLIAPVLGRPIKTS